MRVRTLLATMTALALGGAAAPPADAAYRATTFVNLQRLFDSYGNAGTGDRWTGGALDQSLPLPDGRTLWIFGKTFLGKVNPNGSRAADTPLVNNSYVVQEKSGALSRTVLGANKTALFTPTDPGMFYEPASAVVEGGKLYQILWLMADQSMPHRVDIATLSLPDLKVESIAPMKYVNYAPTVQTGTTPVYPPIWGTAVVQDAQYTYVWGFEDTNGAFEGYAHLSRVPAGQLATATPEYWDGAGWSPLVVRSARVFGGKHLGKRSFTVTKTPTGFKAVTQGHTITGLYEWTTTSLTGKWALAFVYSFKEEATHAAVGFGPQNSQPTHLPRHERKKGQLVFAYTNDGGPDRTSHVRKYRPVFMVAENR